MAADPQHRRMTVEEYLELDRASQDTRYEYIDGYVRAMAGGTVDHMRIGANVFNELDLCLGVQGPCHVYNSDMRVRVCDERHFYPDATISCDVADWRGQNDIVCSPRLVVEVLSKSTELSDRTEKLACYQVCPSIQEIVLISTRYQMVEIYRRDAESWKHLRYRPGQEIELESVDIQLSFEEIYARTRVPVEENWMGQEATERA